MTRKASSSVVVIEGSLQCPGRVLLGGLQTNSTMGEPDAQLSPAAKLLLEMPMEVALVIAWQLLSPLDLRRLAVWPSSAIG